MVMTSEGMLSREIRAPLSQPQSAPLNFPTMGVGALNVSGFDVNKLGAAPLGSNTNVDNSQRSNAISIKNEVKIDAGGDPARAASYFERAVERSTSVLLSNAQSPVR